MKIVDRKMTGRKINNLMIDKGISVLRLQDMMELESAQAIYKWLAGETLPTVDKLVKLSQIFECTIDEIVVQKEEAS
jgi:transcriptional regulator with XRE-family HTH domain